MNYNKKIPYIELFLKKVNKTESCWIWTGCIKKDGYGYLKMNNRSHLAHRASLLLHNINLKDGLVVDHICRVRHCVNPKHLRQITNKANILAGVSICAENSKKTHCKHGHEFTEENTRFYRKRRYCKKCNFIIRQKTSYSKNKDQLSLRQL